MSKQSEIDEAVALLDAPLGDDEKFYDMMKLRAAAGDFIGAGLFAIANAIETQMEYEQKETIAYAAEKIIRHIEKLEENDE